MAGNKNLTANFVKNAKIPGRYYDSNNTGLHLYVRDSGSKSWVQRVNLRGKSIDIGLGNTSKVTLLEARTKSLENAKFISEGVDPRKLKPKANVTPSFKTISDEFLIKKKSELSNSKHFAQWGTTLSSYVHPSLGNMPVNEITVDDIFNTLDKIWLTKNETAQRTRGRIEKILSYAITKRISRRSKSCNLEGKSGTSTPEAFFSSKPSPHARCTMYRYAPLVGCA